MSVDRLALDLDAFISEHRRCGDLDTGRPDERRAGAPVGHLLMRRADRAGSVSGAVVVTTPDSLSEPRGPTT